MSEQYKTAAPKALQNHLGTLLAVLILEPHPSPTDSDSGIGLETRIFNKLLRSLLLLLLLLSRFSRVQLCATP